LSAFLDIISDEVNVKEVSLSGDVASVARHELQVVPATVGPRLGKKTQQVIVAVKKGEWAREGDEIVVAGERLQPGEYSLRLVADSSTPSAALDDGSGVVLLDINLTPELESEGQARDVIRAVQQARRDAQFDVTDRILLALGVSDELRGRLAPFVDMIGSETLATEVSWDSQLERDTPIEGAVIGVKVTALR
jgi:isoleucyl-tRNA synthetase